MVLFAGVFARAVVLAGVLAVAAFLPDAVAATAVWAGVLATTALLTDLFAVMAFFAGVFAEAAILDRVIAIVVTNVKPCLVPGDQSKMTSLSENAIVQDTLIPEPWSGYGYRVLRQWNRIYWTTVLAEQNFDGCVVLTLEARQCVQFFNPVLPPRLRSKEKLARRLQHVE